ncbi:MAG: hypothetical protein IJD48_03995 [Clostridia bacterium]|nr:hypothetical protein [Clostridia bacterium]
MKNSVLVGMALGIIVGAVGATLYQPAQKVIKKGTEAVKEETQSMLNKAANSLKG